LDDLAQDDEDGKPQVKTLVARFSVPQWRRIRGLAVDLDTTIQNLIVAGLGRLFTERGQQPLDPDAPDFPLEPKKKGRGK
jgi:hypothetical protein